MKLGVLLDRFDGTAGGAEAHTAALMRRALGHGDAVVLATLSGEGPEGVETLRVAAGGRRPRRDAAFARDGEHQLRAAGCDVVFAIRHTPVCDVYLPHGGLVSDALAAKDRAAGGAGLLTRVGRAIGGKHAYFRQAEEALLGHAHGPRVIAVSNRLAGRIRTRYPSAARRVTTVVNGVDSAHFQRAPFLESGRALRMSLGLDDALVGLLVAHHPTLKGVEAAVRALAEPAVRDLERPVALLVAGGAVPARVMRLAQQLGVSDRLRAQGAVADARPLYAAADLLLHPTFYDPCSLVCLEALAMELPVITTPMNGAAEVMGHRGGIVVEEPGNAQAIAWALGVLADDGMRAGTARDARELALAEPLGERLDRVLDVCRAVAGTSRV